jgi:signal transduction histidine kinase
VVAIAGVATAAVVLLALPLAVVLQRAHRDEDLLRLQRDTIAATRSIDLSARRDDPIELPSSGPALAVYDRAGRRVAGRGPAAAPAIVREVLRTARPADTTDENQLEVAVPLLDGERVAGAVHAERHASGAAHDTRAAWLVLAAIAVGIIGAAAVAALVVGRRLAQPLERLTAAARRLGQGDSTVRAGRADVPEVDAVGAALDATARRLGELIGRERAFTTNASHQLRTPLAALRIELEGLALRDPGAPELAAALAQVERVEATVDTLLAVARDDREPDARADLEALISAARERWHGILAADARPLRTLPAEEPAIARASENVVNEIVDVLVDNAHRHGAGAVTLGARRLEGWVALDVADEGPGFTDGGGSQEPGSHGIGLELARSLAHTEGGRLIVVSSRPGAVVTLLLRGGADGE